MPVTFDPSDDLDYFDGVEYVTYSRRPLDGSAATEYASVKALKRSTRGQTESFGEGSQATTKSTTWHLKAADLAYPPRRGDRITSLVYGVWEVKSHEVCTLATRYACDCVEVSA